MKLDVEPLARSKMRRRAQLGGKARSAAKPAARTRTNRGDRSSAYRKAICGSVIPDFATLSKKGRRLLTLPRPRLVNVLDYLDKRRNNMCYGWLRKNGYYISSAHAEAAARIIVARRCKQAGMHWRLHNAACVCAIIARQRSAA